MGATSMLEDIEERFWDAVVRSGAEPRGPRTQPRRSPDVVAPAASSGGISGEEKRLFAKVQASVAAYTEHIVPPDQLDQRLDRPGLDIGIALRQYIRFILRTFTAREFADRRAPSAIVLTKLFRMHHGAAAIAAEEMEAITHVYDGDDVWLFEKLKATAEDLAIVRALRVAEAANSERMAVARERLNRAAYLYAECHAFKREGESRTLRQLEALLDRYEFIRDDLLNVVDAAITARKTAQART